MWVSGKIRYLFEMEKKGKTVSMFYHCKFIYLWRDRLTRSCNYCITTVCLKDLPQLCGTGLAPVHAVGDQFNDGGVDNMDSSFETVLLDLQNSAEGIIDDKVGDVILSINETVGGVVSNINNEIQNSVI